MILWVNHIPKTGGTSLRLTLEWLYKESFLKVYGVEDKYEAAQEHLEAYGQVVVSGHFSFGVHREENPTYLCMLRNPLDRVVSEYAHSRRNPKQAYHDLAQGTIDEFLDADTEGSTRNVQVRYLSGCDGLPNEEHLEIAKYNLGTYYVYGIIEYWVRSMRFFQSIFDWPGETPLVKANMSFNRPKTYPVEKIEEMNQLDRELYNYARKRFLDVTARVSIS